MLLVIYGNVRTLNGQRGIMKKYYLSFGAGVNSTAILALIYKKELEYHNLKIVFSDTGCEKPSTYCHIKKMQSLFDIDIIKSDLGNLYDYCFDKKVVPLRMFRWCTDKFKIRPINKWVKENDLDNAIKIIGFCSGEENRVKYNENVEYPLIDMGIDRNECKKIIESVGWDIPDKSGCYICPFQKKLEWIALLKNDIDLFNKVVDLENNTKNNMTITGKPLKEWIYNEKYQERLFDFDEFQHCICRSD